MYLTGNELELEFNHLIQLSCQTHDLEVGSEGGYNVVVKDFSKYFWLFKGQKIFCSK